MQHYKNYLPKDITSPTVAVFDKDGTLTPPNEKILPEMAGILASVTQEMPVVILTARSLPVIQEQMLHGLQNTNYKQENLVFGCANGSEIYEYVDGKYVKKSTVPWSLDMSLFEKAKNRLQEQLGVSVAVEPYSDTMVGIVCIPRSSTAEERNAFDPDKSRRLQYIDIIRDLFPPEYDIVPGGKTSIDIGITNKWYGMRHVLDYLWIDADEVFFFWDNFGPHGNDESVRATGVTTVEVENPDVTAALLQEFLSRKKHN